MSDSTARVSLRESLHGMFTAVPRRYDLINHVITWGFDKRWRREAARQCLAVRPQQVLDLCCGTGDLAINISRLAQYDVAVTGLDYSQPMLAIAVKKSASLVGQGRILFSCGDAANLPFADGSFDCAGISFAFRNLTYRNPLAQRHLAEVLRVLTSGGRYVIVETGQPESRLIRQLYHLYLRHLVSRVGYWLSGNRVAYHYLAESASRFYTAEEVVEMLLGAGFREVSFRRLFFGAVTVHVAVK